MNMTEFLEGYSSDDIASKLNGSVVRVDGDLRLITAVDDDCYATLYEYNNEEWGRTTSEHLFDLSLDLTCPDEGYINIDDTVIRLVRVPRRQWKMGYYYRNYRAIDTSGWTNEQYTHLPKSIYTFFEPYYPAYEQALAQVSNRHLRAVAISKTYSLSREGNRVVFHFEGSPIGSYRAGLLHLEPFAECLGDFITNQVPEVKVA